MQPLLLWCRRLAFCLLALTLCVSAQPPSPSEPQEVGVLMKQAGNGQFQSLEVVNALKQTDFGFFSGIEVYFTIPGRRSSVRFAKGEPLEFYLKSFLDSSDPRAAFFPIRDPMKFTLFTTEDDGDSRRVVLEDSGLGGTERRAGSPLNARLFGVSSFQLVPTQPLAPGEYVVRYPLDSATGFRLFCFGIDP